MSYLKLFNNINIYFLAIFIFSSGCLLDPLNTISSTGSGIKLESFEFNPKIIDDNMKTTVYLSLKNTGTYDASDVNIIFFGLNDKEWDITKSTGTEGSVSLDAPVLFKKIRAKNKEENIPMQKKNINLVLENIQNLERDIIYEYNIIARICYNYHTTSTIKVETITENQFLIMTENNKFRQRPITADTTKGPIYMEVISKQPQVVSTKDNNIHLKLKITNIGGGTSALENSCNGIIDPTKSDMESIIENLNKVSIQSDKCWLENNDKNNIYLKKGKSKEIDVVCKAGWSLDKTENIFKITATYSYYFDSNKIKVKVRGTKDFYDNKDKLKKTYKDDFGSEICIKYKEEKNDNKWIIDDNYMKSIYTTIVGPDEVLKEDKIAGFNKKFLFTKIEKDYFDDICDYLPDKTKINEYNNLDKLYVSDTGLLGLTIDDIDQLSNEDLFVTEAQKEFKTELEEQIKKVESELHRGAGESDALNAVDIKYRDLIEVETSDFCSDDDCSAKIIEEPKFGIADNLGIDGNTLLADLNKINNIKPCCYGTDNKGCKYRDDDKRVISDNCYEGKTKFSSGKIESIRVKKGSEERTRTIESLTNGRIKYFELKDFYINKFKKCGFLGIIGETDYVEDDIEKEREIRTIGCLMDIDEGFPTI